MSINYLADSLRNLATGLGTTSERATSSIWYPDYYQRQPLLDAYNSNWLAARIVDVPPNEIKRRWRKVNTPSMDEKDIERFERAERRLKIKSKIVNVKRWARLFGGGGLHIVTDQPSASPLAQLRKGAAFNIVVLDRDDVTAEMIYASTLSTGYNLPASYKATRSGETIHASRFIRFDGRTLPIDLWERNNYWGGSHLAPLLSDVERCDAVTRALAQLADEANIDVIGIPDLMSKLANSQSVAALQTRFSEGQIVKSLYKIMLRDTKEEYDRNELSGSIAGLVDLLQAYYQIPSAGSGIPVTKLLGISPGGLNSTGESDLENYYDMIDTEREGDVADALEVIDPLICQVEFGRTFDDWSYEWQPLWQEDRAEKTSSDKARAETIIEIRDAGLITPAMAAEQLHADSLVSVITPDYLDDLRALEEKGDDDDVGTTSEGDLSFGGDDIQKQALNGAQVTSLVEVATKVKLGELSKEQARGIMSLAFPAISEAEAAAIINVEVTPEEKPEQPPQFRAPPASLPKDTDDSDL